MKLAPNFSLEELTKSSTAIRLGIDNTPSSEHLINMVYVASHILQPVRDHFGRVTEPKKVMCDQAWYKDYNWGSGDTTRHYLINDLLGERIPITEQQYNNSDINNPNQIQK